MCGDQRGVVGSCPRVQADPIDTRSYGRIVCTRRIGDLTLTETVFAPSLVVPLHSHDSARLCFVLNGGFTEQVGGRSKQCGVGSVLFHPRDEPHAQQFGAAASRCLTIQLGRRFTSRLARFDVTVPSRPITAQRRVAWLAMSLYEEFSQSDSTSDLGTEGLCLAILAELAREAAAPFEDAERPRWLKVVQSLLDVRSVEPVRLAELAASVDVHPAHLSRVFHQRLGVTPTAYVRGRRLEWASEMLLRTDLPTSRIAVQAGFCDQGHFTRTFRGATGMTPREFRAASGGRPRHQYETR
jgi:AraC family transcriptional regulator